MFWFKKKASGADTVRQWLNVIFAVTQILAGGLHEFTGWGRSIAGQSAGSQTAVIPATYAFSIWGFIFLFGIFYAVYQALPKQKTNELLRRIGFFTAGAFFFNTVWELVAQLVSFNWPTLIIIILILISSLGAMWRMTTYKKSLSLKEKWFVNVPVSVLAGWVSAATFANLSSVLNQLQFSNFGLSATDFAIVIIILAGIFGAVITIINRGNILYGLTLVWALVAIVIANVQRPNSSVAVVAGSMIVVIGLVVAGSRIKKIASFLG